MDEGEGGEGEAEEGGGRMFGLFGVGVGELGERNGCGCGADMVVGVLGDGMWERSCGMVGAELSRFIGWSCWKGSGDVVDTAARATTACIACIKSWGFSG